MLLAGALRVVEKLVPATALDRNMPLAAWCECRPVVRAAAEAAEQRTKGEAVDEEGWRAVRMALTGLTLSRMREMRRAPIVEGMMGSFLPTKACFDKESLVSALRYIGLPHVHTCQPAAGGIPSILLPSS